MSVRTDRALRTFSAKVLIVRLASWAGITKAHPENVMAPVKLGYAVSLLEQRGHHVTLIDTETGLYSQEDVIRTLRTMRPEVIVLHGITTAVPSIQRMGRLARELLPDALLVASGQHATARPQDFLHPGSPFHACPTLEYEEVLSDLVEAWSMGDLRGVAGIVLPEAEGGILRTPPRPLRAAGKPPGGVVAWPPVPRRYSAYQRYLCDCAGAACPPSPWCRPPSGTLVAGGDRSPAAPSPASRALG